MAAPDGPVAPQSQGWSRTARPGLLFLALIASFAAAIVLVCLLPVSKEQRLAQLDGTIYDNAIWANRRITADATPIDVAVIGDSRLEVGISGPKMEQDLSRLLGHPIHVANFSMLHEGRNVHYLLLRDLIRRQPNLKVAIISVIERPSRKGHPVFYQVADARDLVTAPLVINPSYFPDLLSLPFRQLSLFAGALINPPLAPKPYAGSNPETTRLAAADFGKPSADKIIAPAKLLEGLRGNEPEPIYLPAKWRDREFVADSYYLRRMTELAQAHGVRLVFVYPPYFSYNKPQLYADRYGKTGCLVTFPELATDSRLHRDYGHTNKAGAWLMTTRVTQAVKQALDPASGGACAAHPF